MTAMRSRDVARLLKQKAGIFLDVSLGGSTQPNSVTLLGDVQHNPLALPWPLPDRCVHTAVVTHVLEYLDPGDVFTFFDEMHRVVRPLGLVYLSGPYGGDESHGWISDPAHRVRVTEQTFAWLDPRLPFYAAKHADVGRPTPKPWHTLAVARVPGAHGTHSYNVQLQAVEP